MQIPIEREKWVIRSFKLKTRMVRLRRDTICLYTFKKNYSTEFPYFLALATMTIKIDPNTLQNILQNHITTIFFIFMVYMSFCEQYNNILFAIRGRESECDRERESEREET